MLATLRLFKAMPITRHHGAKFSESAATWTLPHGYLLDPDVTFEHECADVMSLVNGLYGRNGVDLNQGFHKSFATVKNAELVDLYVAQAIHYLTTYGRPEGLDNDRVCIPAEKLDVPDLEGDFPIVVIRGLTPVELQDALFGLLTTGAALSDQSVQDAIEIAKLVDWPAWKIEAVKNREVQTALFDHFYLVPTKPEDFVRFLVYKATGRTQIVKNFALNEAIRDIDADTQGQLVWAFNRYEKQVGLWKLGEVFNRYKPVFLALRQNVSLKKYVNQVSRLAKENHRAMPEDYLNAVTAKIKDRTITGPHLNAALQRASFFRKARLAEALQFRAGEADAIAYRIRNGKSWATEFSLDEDSRTLNSAALGHTLRSLADDLKPKVEGKKMFIPGGVTYGLPSSEKNFTGNIPAGTSVTVPQDMVIGVHWTNLPLTPVKDGGLWNRGRGQQDIQIDLDLSLTSADGKIGWDADYRDGRNGIYFSGDMTNAPGPHGAAELFHIGAEARGSWLLNLNYYNYYSEHGEVPFKVVVAQDERRNVNADYMLNPNNLLAFSPSAINDQHKMLGIVVADDESTRFIFSEASISQGVSSRVNGPAELSRKFLLAKASNPISLNNLLLAAGAIWVDTPAEADIDLSLESVDKSTLLTLLA